MGFTALEGLPMGTRTGSVDPDVVLYLMKELRMDAALIEKLLYQGSGLLGISGVSSDRRTLLASAEPQPRFAVDVFVSRVARELGSLAAALGGIDALVFTGGIGEHAAPISRASAGTGAVARLRMRRRGKREERIARALRYATARSVCRVSCCSASATQ